MRVGRIQQKILDFISKAESGSAYIGPGCRVSGTPLAGFDWEEVRPSLESLIKRGIIWTTGGHYPVYHITEDPK